jgi:hypothetical protein
MRNEIVTIRDSDEKIWTGPIVSIFRIDNWALLWAWLTSGLWLLFQSRKHVTVRVNGELHYGLLIKPDK